MMRRAEHEQGSARRFRALFDGHRDAVLGYALRRVDDPADAADVVADTFLVAWRRLDDVPAGDARPWLFSVARRVLANKRRGEQRRGALAERLGQELAVRVPEEAADARNERVREAVARLSPDAREVLLLTCWEGLTPAQVATALGVRAVAVRSRLHRARRQLQAELAGTADEPALPCGPQNRYVGYVEEAGR